MLTQHLIHNFFYFFLFIDTYNCSIFFNIIIIKMKEF